jgi:hypothetical protein
MVFRLIDAEQNYEGLYTIYAETTHCGNVCFTIDLDKVKELSGKRKKNRFWRKFKWW